MIRLTFLNEQSARFAELSLYFRVTGGVVWTQPERGPLASWTDHGWKHNDSVWAGMRFEGPCRLVLGLSRDPVRVSEPLLSVSVVGRQLSANGIPVALYDPRLEHWFGAAAGISWPAFRIESAELRTPSVKQRLRGDVTAAKSS